MAAPYGRMIECVVVVSPDKRGKIVVNAKGRQAERQILRRGWTDIGQWVAPEGWTDNTTVIYNPAEVKHGVLLHGFRFHDRDSEKNVVICTTGRTEADLKRAVTFMKKQLYWKVVRGQWVAP